MSNDLSDRDALKLIRAAEPDAGAELPDAVALDVVHRAQSGQTPAAIADAYRQPSEEAPAFDFAHVIIEFSHLVVAIRTIYEVVAWAGHTIGVDELYDQALAELKGRIDDRYFPAVRRMIVAVKERLNTDDKKNG